MTTHVDAQVKALLAAPASQLTLVFESFAFKRGIPMDADYVFDVRMLPNPHYEAALRELTGRDAPVAEFLAAAHRAAGFDSGPGFCIVLFGEPTAYPHGVPYPQVLKEGDVVLVDPAGPEAVAVFCAGRLAHLTAAGAARLG